jgi:LysM repeat protein
MSEEPAVPIPADKPRLCPDCGARVAERATTCLMCGASLTEDQAPEEAPQKRPPRQHTRWLFWVVAILVAVGVTVTGYLVLQPLLAPPPPSPTPTPSPTRTPTSTPTPTPSQEPTPTPTATPLPPRAHQVREGELLVDIAAMYDTTVEEILALNPGITPELLQVNQVLLIPAAVPTPGPTETPEPQGPTPTPGPYLVHVVAPGDTLLSIAEQYSVTVALLRAANPDIPPGSDVIRVNQSLIIPQGTPVPTPTATFDPNATPTPIPLYPPPPLLSPPDEAVFGGPDAAIVLEWASVGLLRSDEWYELQLDRSGMEPVVLRTWTTTYRVPADLYPPPGEPVREFRWQVRVVRRIRGTDEYEIASEPGSVRVFGWLEANPTPTAQPATTAPTPTP